MAIIHTARKNLKEEIMQKLRFRTLEKRKRQNAVLTIRDEAQVDSNIAILKIINTIRCIFFFFLEK